MKTWEQIYIEQIVKWSELVTEDKPLDRYWCVGRSAAMVATN